MLTERREHRAGPGPGTTIDRYEVVLPIATGGMAVVYAVRRKHRSGFDKLLALKMILPHLAKEEQFTAMFLDEARIASQIQHPNVVQVFDVGEHEGTPYIVMEFLRGHSLAAVQRQCARLGTVLPRPVLYEILARAADGLHAAHAAKGPDGKELAVVHRDVSPQNIHVCYDGQVKVVDFGVAAARGKATTTRTGEVKGKLGYLSPEQITRPKEVDAHTDIWAFGVMAWESVATSRLFRGENDGDTVYNILHRPITRLSEHVADVEPAVDDLVQQCLERSAHRRPNHMGELAAGFRSCVHTGDPSASIAEFMRSTFVVERKLEEERLTSALSPEPELIAPAAEARSGMIPIHVEAPEKIRRSRAPVVWTAIALSGLAAVSAFVAVDPLASSAAATSKHIEKPAVVEQPPVATDPEPAEPAMAEEAAIAGPPAELERASPRRRATRRERPAQAAVAVPTAEVVASMNEAPPVEPTAMRADGILASPYGMRTDP